MPDKSLPPASTLRRYGEWMCHHGPTRNSFNLDDLLRSPTVTRYAFFKGIRNAARSIIREDKPGLPEMQLKELTAFVIAYPVGHGRRLTGDEPLDQKTNVLLTSTMLKYIENNAPEVGPWIREAVERRIAEEIAAEEEAKNGTQ